MQEKYDKIYGMIYKSGDSSVVTIPTNVMKGGGYENGDDVEIYIRKRKVE